MNKDLDEKLCKNFPLLYRDRQRSMQSTCMCWGIDTGAGWFNIIWELSSKLEPLIQKWIDENKPTECANCGCERNLHEFVDPIKQTSERTGKCFNLHYLPYTFQWKWKPLSWPSEIQNWADRWKTLKNKYFKYYFIERIKYRISKMINFILGDILFAQFGLTKVKPCWCKKFILNHPCASQVKSKFATLRFYMTSESKEMSALIREAEAKSAITCEECGNVGSLRDDRYWVETLCDDCEKKRSDEEGRWLY